MLTEPLTTYTLNKTLLKITFQQLKMDSEIQFPQQRFLFINVWTEMILLRKRCRILRLNFNKSKWMDFPRKNLNRISENNKTKPKVNVCTSEFDFDFKWCWLLLWVVSKDWCERSSDCYITYTWVHHNMSEPKLIISSELSNYRTYNQTKDNQLFSCEHTHPKYNITCWDQQTYE